MNTKLRRKLLVVAITPAFLLGSVSVLAASENTFKNAFSSLDDNNDGYLAADDIINDGNFKIEEDVFRENWNAADFDNNGYLDRIEYAYFRTYHAMDYNGEI